jgi:hypothetical protein
MLSGRYSLNSKVKNDKKAEKIFLIKGDKTYYS